MFQVVHFSRLYLTGWSQKQFISLPLHFLFFSLLPLSVVVLSLFLFYRYYNELGSSGLSQCIFFFLSSEYTAFLEPIILIIQIKSRNFISSKEITIPVFNSLMLGLLITLILFIQLLNWNTVLAYFHLVAHSLPNSVSANLS